MTIKIRAYHEHDLSAIRDMIMQTWYRKASQLDNKLTQTVVHLDIDMRLKESSFGLVAEKDNRVLGVFLGDVQDATKHLRLHAPNTIDDVYTLAFSDNPLRKQLLDQLRNEIHANRILDKNHSAPYEGRVELFILSPDAHGLGIGGKLWDAGMAQFKTQRVKNYILHTDSDCDYSFYEYKGLKADPIYNSPYDEGFQHLLYAGVVED